MKLLLAVSGGIDSTYLAERASELFPEASFAIAHCNFCLRGEESDADESFVRSWCKSRQAEVFVRRFDTEAVAAEEGISIEMAARKLRYSWFADLCKEHGFDAVVVAHNADDNAETLMLNLLRGTGSRGIRGMSEDGMVEGVRVLRPMLGITRSEITAWMTGHGKTWREDRTNAGTEYKRNKIRNLAFPVFREINPSYVKTLGQDMERFAQVDDIAEDYFRASGLDPMHIDIKALMAFRHWKYLLFRLTEGRLNAAELDALCNCLESGRQISGRRFGAIVAGSGFLVPADAECISWSWEIKPRGEFSTLKQPHGILLMDASLVPAPPQVRHWQDGDWLIPLGMKGRKKVSDLFTDLKYTLPQTEAALVIPYPGDGSGRVAAVIGERMDDSLKVTDETASILKISI